MIKGTTLAVATAAVATVAAVTAAALLTTLPKKPAVNPTLSPTSSDNVSSALNTNGDSDSVNLTKDNLSNSVSNSPNCTTPTSSRSNTSSSFPGGGNGTTLCAYQSEITVPIAVAKVVGDPPKEFQGQVALLYLIVDETNHNLQRVGFMPAVDGKLVQADKKEFPISDINDRGAVLYSTRKLGQPIRVLRLRTKDTPLSASQGGTISLIYLKDGNIFHWNYGEVDITIRRDPAKKWVAERDGHIFNQVSFEANDKGIKRVTFSLTN